jgi:hypothetical protein
MVQKAAAGQPFFANFPPDTTREQYLLIQGMVFRYDSGSGSTGLFSYTLPKINFQTLYIKPTNKQNYEKEQHDQTGRICIEHHSPAPFHESAG